MNTNEGKDGPVYNLDWNPNSKEFCVVYGCESLRHYDII